MSTTVNILAVVFPKGGVGKTHTCWNIANYFGMAGLAKGEDARRVLLVDMDSQANLGGIMVKSHFDDAPSFRHDPTYYDEVFNRFSEAGYLTTVDMMTELPDGDLENSPAFQLVGGLDIYGMFARDSDSDAFDEIAFDDPKELGTRLQDNLLDYAELHGIDLIILDAPPSPDSRVLRTSLYTVTDLLMPMEALSEYSAQGMHTLHQNLEKVLAHRRELDDPLNVVGAMLNMVKRNSSRHREAADEIASVYPLFGEFMLPQTMDEREQWSKAVQNGKFVYNSGLPRLMRRQVLTEIRDLGVQLSERLSPGIVLDEEVLEGE